MPNFMKMLIQELECSVPLIKMVYPTVFKVHVFKEFWHNTLTFIGAHLEVVWRLDEEHGISIQWVKLMFGMPKGL